MKSRLRSLLEHLATLALDAEGAAVGISITQTQAAVLAAAFAVGRRQGVGGIAETLSISQSHATTTLQKLEDMGLIHRVVRDGEKLQSILLTRAGSDVLLRVEDAESFVEDSVLSALDETSREAFVRALVDACQGVGPEEA